MKMKFHLKIKFLKFLLLIFTGYLYSFETFLEGQYNEYLPGNDADPLNRPNIPFRTNTNRYSDGFTSTSFFEATSPHFPQYYGPVTNTSERYKHYLAYLISAREQGVAMYGLGDARNEDVRNNITSLKSFMSLPNPSKIFPVYAARKWNPSDFAIRQGETYKVEVFGKNSLDEVIEQYWNDGGIKVNAAGYVSYFDSVSNCYVALGNCMSHLKKKRRLPSAPWMSLGCVIGQFIRPIVEVQPGFEMETRYLPLDESELLPTLFNVGLSITFNAQFTGTLICFANDAHNLYWNNHGYINVTVTRISWPPIKENYYQNLYLPSCDSARIIYINHGINTGPNKTPCNPNFGGGWTEEQINISSTAYLFS